MNTLILLNLLLSYGVPRQDAEMLICIAAFESRLNPRAYNDKLNRNGTVDVGLFQINSVNYEACEVSKDDLFDYKVNTECAVQVYKAQGLKAWSTYKFCRKGNKDD